MKSLLFLDGLIRFIYMSQMNQTIAGTVRSHMKTAQAVKDALLNIRSGNQTLFYQNVNAIARSLVWVEMEANRAPGSGRKHFPDGSSAGLRFTDGTSAGFNPKPTDFNSHPLANVILRGLGNILSESDPTFVSEEVMSLITTAAETMEPEPLYETDLLAPKGLLIFETPIILKDFHPVTGVLDDRIKLAIRGIAWNTSLINVGAREDAVTQERGLHMIIFTDGGPAGQLYVDTYNTFAEQQTEYDIEPQTQLYENGTTDDLVCVDYHAWAFGRNWGVQQTDEFSVVGYNNPELISTISFLRRFFLTLMRFAWQEIITPTPTNDVPRPDRRAAERMFGQKKENLLSVLRLRRARTKSEVETEGYTLQWRVVVRGHWRRQYYPSMGPVDAPDSHRLIWINPHVKGPDDAPVRYNHKVTAIIR